MSYPADPYWANVKNLLHFDGVNGGKRIADEKNNVWSVGSTAVLSSAQKKFGNTSLYCDGSGSGSVYRNQFLDWGAEDVTIEAWVFPLEQSATLPMFVSHGGSSYFGLAIRPPSYPGKALVVLNNTVALESATTIALNTWSHIAFTRRYIALGGTIISLYINGVLDSSVVNPYRLNVTANTTLSTVVNDASTAFKGYIAEFRYTLGVNRYPTDFTPPTAALPGSGVVDPYYDKVKLLMHFDGEHNASVFKDQKGNTALIAGAAVTHTSTGRFGRSSFYPYSTNGVGVLNPELMLGSEDFTIELFTYREGNTGVYEDVFTMLDAAGTSAGLRIQRQYWGSTYLTVNGTLVATLASNESASSWRHVALCREGGVITLFENGTRYGNYAIGSTTISSNGSFWIGRAPVVAGTGWGSGYFDELRVTKGVARYSKNNGSYTVPTEPFPNAGPNFLSGTVLDYDNVPLARTVRAFRRSDSMLTDTTVSNASTGAYELRATDMSEHYVVVFDDTRNAMVYDHIEPVV